MIFKLINSTLQICYKLSPSIMIQYIANLLTTTIECDKKELYFIGLIDILTHYGMKKRTAQAAKTVKHGSGAEISTVKPEQYARRFLEFIEKVLD